MQTGAERQFETEEKVGSDVDLQHMIECGFISQLSKSLISLLPSRLKISVWTQSEGGLIKISPCPHSCLSSSQSRISGKR